MITETDEQNVTRKLIHALNSWYTLADAHMLENVKALFNMHVCVLTDVLYLTVVLCTCAHPDARCARRRSLPNKSLVFMLLGPP